MHGREGYFVDGEGLVGDDDDGAAAGPPPGTFRFSRLGPRGGAPLSDTLLEKLARAMSQPGTQRDAGARVPAGFTYLGQFIDHDLTKDDTAGGLNPPVEVPGLAQGRSPALDLDSLYGSGPTDPADSKFYVGAKLKVGATKTVNFPPNDPDVAQDRSGFDLPRFGGSGTAAQKRVAVIPDPRNDENLAVAQVHLAMIRFHNRVVDRLAPTTPANVLFTSVRTLVTKHYQWMIRHDYLPRIVDRAIVEDVFTNGRRFFETGAAQSSIPTMPIEFSVAAYRLGHSQVRDVYHWNRVFGRSAPTAGLKELFDFSGVGGTLAPGGASPGSDRLPTNWIPDMRRLFDLGPSFAPPPGRRNQAKRIDTLMVDPLANLPLSTFGGNSTTPAIERNLAFRNLKRAAKVRLATGQQMAQILGITPLTPTQILNGFGGADLSGLTAAERTAVTTRTPLWFYILREAELNNGRLTGVGGRIVAETFHRAIEGSRDSIVRDTNFRPTLGLSLGPISRMFTMRHLLLLAYDSDNAELNPLGDQP